MESKECRYCKEEIKENAIKCKHCGEATEHPLMGIVWTFFYIICFFCGMFFWLWYRGVIFNN